MADKLPDHIVKQYGTSRAFKSRKRQLLRRMRTLSDELLQGSAFFPGGAKAVDRLRYEIKVLSNELSAKNWGR